MNINLKTKLYAHWKNQKTSALNPGLTMYAIKIFENENSIFLPKDFVNYLTLSNGFTNTDRNDDWSVGDDEGFEFYPLNKEYLIGKKYLIFSYWAIGLIEYAICIDETENNGIVIQTIDRDRGCFLAKNFNEFISLYLTNDDALFFTTGEILSLI
jgi:hypothetical protein